MKVEDPMGNNLVEAEEAIPSRSQDMEIKVENDDEDDDGPPPGWQPIVRSPPPPLPPIERMGSKNLEEGELKAEVYGEEGKLKKRSEEQVNHSHTGAMEIKEIKQEGGEGEEDNDDGPPPGWYPSLPSSSVPSSSLSPTGRTGSTNNGKDEGEVKANIFGDQVRVRSNDEINGEGAIPAHTEGVEKEIKREGEDDDDDDGLPPGWHPIVPSPSVPSPSLPSMGRTGSKENEKEEVELKANILGDQVSIRSKEIKREEAILARTEGMKKEFKDGEEDDDGPPPGWQPIPIVPSSPIPTPSLPPTEMAQMVCGSCRRLLSYPQGARHVKCSCCQTVNLVLEEHQVGQVKCGSCSILLMYPYGAPSVRCSCCRFVTEIGEHNKRPPWSTQQGHPAPTLHPVQ